MAVEDHGMDGTQSGNTVRAYVPSGRRQSRRLGRETAPQLLRFGHAHERALLLRLHRQIQSGVPDDPFAVFYFDAGSERTPS